MNKTTLILFVAFLLSVSICHLNVHYLYSKLDEIKILLHEQNIDILCLCETLFNQEFCDDELKINAYDFIRKDRQTHGGGLIIYI